MNEAFRSAPRTSVQAAVPLQLSVVVPTFNERDNVPLFRSWIARWSAFAWEAMFVDDNSPDGTSEAVRQLAEIDRPRPLHPADRPARACPAPVSKVSWQSSAPCVAVMDADLQHDETLLAADAGIAAKRRFRPGDR